jgi:hypothetical protein
MFAHFFVFDDNEEESTEGEMQTLTATADATAYTTAYTTPTPMATIGGDNGDGSVTLSM